jgi:hypothetical protein
MRSFDKAYKTSRQRTLNEQQKAFAADRAKLIAAVKKEYGVSDFNSLNENEKAEYKSIIDSMWSKECGLNDKGIKFIAEGNAPLTDKSSDERIEKWFRNEVKSDIDNIIMCIVSKGSCDMVVSLMEKIKESTGNAIKKSDAKRWLCDVVCRHICSQVKSVKI